MQVIIFCITELMRHSPALNVGVYPDPIGANIIVLMKRINPIVVLESGKMAKVSTCLYCTRKRRNAPVIKLTRAEQSLRDM